ncbi:hypothetical protein QVD17_20436 [Tagetes erecta]|uniref:Uncharacterized protein n=1 Tax=Tagetes erecta TaxID=13708 RepID=A0AAD8KLI0_TARER|nr:hypothetical protein QVD17_20436 [Tagetes erecta]
MINNIHQPIAKRTRNQWYHANSSARKQSRKTETRDNWIEKKASKTANQKGAESSHRPVNTGKHTYFLYSDDEEADDHTTKKSSADAEKVTKGKEKVDFVTVKKEEGDMEESGEDIQENVTTSSLESTEYESLISSSESESDDSDDSDFTLENKFETKKKDFERSDKEKEQDDSDVLFSPTDELRDDYVHEKQAAKRKEKVPSVTIKEEESDTEDDEVLQKNLIVISSDSTEDDEDESLSSSERESHDSNDSGFSLKHEMPHQSATNNPSLTRSDKEKVGSETVDQKVKGLAVNTMDESSDTSADEKQNANPITHKKSKKGTAVNTTNMEKTDQKPMDESSDTSVDEKQNANLIKHKKSDKGPAVNTTNMEKTDKKPMDESSDTSVEEKQNADPIKQEKYEKCRQRDDVEATLDSIISDEDVEDKKEDYCIPYKFRFYDSEDESTNQNTDEWGAEALFQEMDFSLTCEEVGSSTTPKVKNTETDDYYDDVDPCERGDHGDSYFDEQIGLRCYQCGAVLLESRYVIPKLATYAPGSSRRRRSLNEQHSNSQEGLFSMGLGSNPIEICKQTKGTVWELVPASIQARMYPHQQEGFEFLWKNLAETIELSSLHTLNPRGGGGDGGGCIISHAPGTGKTFLTIVFMESFLKKFPKCCPVIVAPASMLLTWEEEFKKWEVGFSFINLHNTEPLRKEVIISGSRHNKDLIRAMKIRYWVKGRSVLGLSYHLYKKLAGDSENQNKNDERIKTLLLDKPGLVVLDEGHTPRNERSNIWKEILKLETKNRVILSGTPFQNNFRELFNTMRIVRPEIAKSIQKETFYVDMINSKNMMKSDRRSSSGDIEKLKEIISPFVHVHKGHILESKLPGLKQCVILLNPPPFQRSFIVNLGKSASTLEYDHKVALVSVHPSLILHCLLSEKEEKVINKQKLEEVRLEPKFGVKTRFVMELIRLSLSLDEKVLIFTQYIHPSDLLQDQIAGAFGWAVGKEITRIKGKTNQTHRQTIINAFNNPKSELKVLLAATKCCSEGIHLIGGSRVVLLDVVWNPSVEKQAISRAYRLGQKKVVYTYHLMTDGTTEEEKYDRQVEKGRVAEMVFSSASVAGGEAKKKVIVDDEILQQMVDHKELEDIFKKIRYLQ